MAHINESTSIASFRSLQGNSRTWVSFGDNTLSVIYYCTWELCIACTEVRALAVSQTRWQRWLGTSTPRRKEAWSGQRFRSKAAWMIWDKTLELALNLATHPWKSYSASVPQYLTYKWGQLCHPPYKLYFGIQMVNIQRHLQDMVEHNELSANDTIMAHPVNSLNMNWTARKCSVPGTRNIQACPPEAHSVDMKPI